VNYISLWSAALAASTAPAPQSVTLSNAILTLLLAVGVVAPFLGLGNLPLVDTDEPRYAGAAKVMSETGDWLHPQFNEEPRHAKPALVYWLIVGSYRVFGVSEWSARFHAPVFSGLIALGLLLVGRRWLGWEGGLVAAVVWVSLPQTTVWARGCLTDNVLTLFIAGACVALYSAGQAQGATKLGAYLVAGLLSGAAMWTKGPVGLAVPGLVWLVHHRRPRAWWNEIRGGAGLGALVALAVVTPWYISQWRTYGDEYLRTFIGGDNLSRFSQAPPNQRAWWSPLYYVAILMAAAFPWSAGLPWAMARARSAGRQIEEARLAGFALAWLVTVIVVFSFSATKNPQYIQSAYPALALLVAAGVAGRSEGPVSGRRWALALTLAFGAVLIAAIGMLPQVVSADAGRRGIDLWRDHWPWSAVTLSLLPLALGLPGLVAACVDRSARGWSAVSALVGLTLLVAPAYAYGPAVRAYRIDPFHEAGVALSASMAPGGAVYAWGHGVRSSSVVFYSGHRVVEVRAEEGARLPDLLTAGDGLITRADLVGSMPPIEGLRALETGASGLGEWVKLYVVDGKNEPPAL
jgi:4-amino-4-deoxy-L-arabinose transferase-like glycosyltransferase